MSLEITLENMTIGKNSKLFEDLKYKRGDTKIRLSCMTIDEYAELFQNLNIDELCSTIQEKIQSMDSSSEEYIQIKKLLNTNHKNKHEFTKKLLQHVASFTEGVAVNILSSMIMGR